MVATYRSIGANPKLASCSVKGGRAGNGGSGRRGCCAQLQADPGYGVAQQQSVAPMVTGIWRTEEAGRIEPYPAALVRRGPPALGENVPDGTRQRSRRAGVCRSVEECMRRRVSWKGCLCFRRRYGARGVGVRMGATTGNRIKCARSS